MNIGNFIIFRSLPSQCPKNHVSDFYDQHPGHMTSTYFNCSHFPQWLAIEYIKQKLAMLRPQAKDRRALTASSSAIALSISSPSYDIPSHAALNVVQRVSLEDDV